MTKIQDRHVVPRHAMRRVLSESLGRVRTADPRTSVAVLCYHSMPALACGPERTRPAVALTFHDEYRDKVTHVLPFLADVGVPATFFVTVGLVDGNRDVIDRPAAIRGASRAAVVSVGAVWRSFGPGCQMVGSRAAGKCPGKG